MSKKTLLRKRLQLLMVLAFGLMANALLHAQSTQDTLSINLQQAEKIFMDSNFLSLA